MERNPPQSHTAWPINPSLPYPLTEVKPRLGETVGARAMAGTNLPWLGVGSQTPATATSGSPAAGFAIPSAFGSVSEQCAQVDSAYSGLKGLSGFCSFELLSWL